MRQHILIADDEAPIRKTLADVLAEQGFRVTTAENGRQAVRQMEQGDVDVALVDIRMPEMDGMEVLARAREVSPQTQIIIITAFGSVETAVEAMKMGASDYVTKPFLFEDILMKVDRLLDMRRLANENTRLRTELEERHKFEGIVGISEALQDVLEVVHRLAQTRTSALITGESGTGKELIARAIHYNGITSSGRFVAVNCAALPETLVESELFGYKRGAFSGPIRDKQGLFEVADNGTIFLDEISTMPLAIQAKLLRAIEEKQFLPIGDTELVETNARILCATNRNLKVEVDEGRFRGDLYYRLNVVEVHISPLRERREDIPALVDHFIATYRRELNKECAGLSPEAMNAMLAYDWPGNVRELENVIERGVIFCDGGIIDLCDLAFARDGDFSGPARQGDLKSTLRAVEKQHIANVLRSCNYNKIAAAEALNIGLSSLYRKIDELGLARSDGRPAPGGAKRASRGAEPQAESADEA
jgi:DNA-binding NtrC family response regulator